MPTYCPKEKIALPSDAVEQLHALIRTIAQLEPGYNEKMEKGFDNPEAIETAQQAARLIRMRSCARALLGSKVAGIGVEQAARELLECNGHTPQKIKPYIEPGGVIHKALEGALESSKSSGAAPAR